MRQAHRPKEVMLSRGIRSSLGEVDPLCRDVRSLLEEHGLAAVSFTTELVARECLKNAIVHGNRRDAGKGVLFDLVIKRKWIYLKITDEGPGFNWRKAKRGVLPAETAVGGRGLAICALYAHRTTFNRRGNEVRLWIDKEPRRFEHDGRLHDRT